MWIWFLCGVFSLTVSQCSADFNRLPNFMTPCNRSDPDFYKCVKGNVEALKPKLKEGIPELFIPSLYPLVIPPITVNTEDRVKVRFKDIQIFNADDFNVDQFDINLEHHRVDLSVKFPRLRIKSTYNVKGKFLFLTFDENGPADGNYTNSQLHLGLKGTPYLQNDKEYLKWEKETISLTVDTSHLVLEKLFGNHTEINDRINTVINENMDTIISDLQPVLKSVISELVFGVVNKLFSNYSVKELFLE